MRPIVWSVLLLTASNVFMTFAWYAHLKELNHKPWIVAALVSWGIALFEYLLQVPANRIGYTVLSVGQLKIMQEVITLTVFVPFALLYLKEPLKLDYLWAGLVHTRRGVFYLSQSAAGWLSEIAQSQSGRLFAGPNPPPPGVSMIKAVTGIEL